MKLVLCLWLVTVGWAFVPHAPNFSPVVAVCLLTGLLLRSGVSVAVMALLLLGRDVGFALFSYAPTGGGLASWEASVVATAANSLCFLLVGVWGLMAARAFRGPGGGPRLSWPCWAGGATGAAVVFFVSSNFFVWWGGLMYPPTWQGLWACYVAGLPFFHHTWLSTALFSGAGIFIYNAVGQSLQNEKKFATLKM